MNALTFGPPPYPIEAFPATPRNAGLEVVRNVQAPDAIVGMCMIAAMAVTCQGLADVKLPNGQVRPLSLNVLIVAESGERKTTVDALVFAPITEHDVAAAAAYRKEIEGFKVNNDVWESVGKGLRARLADLMRKGDPADGAEDEIAAHAQRKPTKPRLRRIIRNNITSRAIFDALEGNGESIAIATDEGEVLFKSDAMSQLGLLNKAWDGAGMLSLDRADMNHVVAMNPRVSISIMTQSSVLQAYVEKKGTIAKGSGHWARYLVGWPTTTQGWRQVTQGEPGWDNLKKFQERMKDLLRQLGERSLTEDIQRQTLEFSEDAKIRWVDLARETESLLRPGGEFNDINDFASKVMEIMGRVAAVMHLFSGDGGAISLDRLERAKEVVIWHVDEYKKLFSPRHQVSQVDKDAKALARYLRDNWLGFGTRTWMRKNLVLRNGPIRGRDRLGCALTLLQQHNAVWMSPPGQAGPRIIEFNDAYFGQM